MLVGFRLHRSLYNLCVKDIKTSSQRSEYYSVANATLHTNGYFHIAFVFKYIKCERALSPDTVVSTKCETLHVSTKLSISSS